MTMTIIRTFFLVFIWSASSAQAEPIVWKDACADAVDKLAGMNPKTAIKVWEVAIPYNKSRRHPQTKKVQVIGSFAEYHSAFDVGGRFLMVLGFCKFTNDVKQPQSPGSKLMGARILNKQYASSPFQPGTSSLKMRLIHKKM